MSRILSHNPITGVTERVKYDEQSDSLIVETSQDVSKILDTTSHLRNDDSVTRKGMKEDWLHYCHIPDAIIVKLRNEFGCNIFEPDQAKRAFRLINIHFPYLKTTNMIHNPKGE